MPLPVKQSSPSLADNALRLPTEFPPLPADVGERFESLERWQQEVRQFFREYESGVRDFAGAVQDTNELGGVLIADPQTGAVYIKPIRGGGIYADAATPFFINRDGYFSLGSALTWNPVEKKLTVRGEIDVDSGTIGGFTIGDTLLHAGSGASYIALNASGVSGVIMGVLAVSDYAVFSAAGALGSYPSGNNSYALGNGILILKQDGATHALNLDGANSRIEFGQALDTNLYRSGANTLKTDDTFLAANMQVAAGGFLKLGNAATLIADTPVIAYVILTDSAGNNVRVAVV